MTNFIPIFPLQLVVYPGEELNLHIFEPRYKQLIGECYDASKPFGIPAVIQNKLAEMGTLMTVTEIVKVYENGELDIRTRGLRVFRILEVVREIPEKLYSGAIVNYPDNEDQGSRELMQKVVLGLRAMHKLLNVEKNFKKPDELLTAYDVAHHAGMNIEEEYEMLGLLKELQRQEYLKRHILKVLPILQESENLKDRIKLNGHFKNLSSFDFDL
jgi:uncharacterized protein